jgi:putative transcriptional regulator
MSRILENVHETALRLHQAGFVDTVTMREFDKLCLPQLPHFSPQDIRTIRNNNHVSQTVFAKHLNVKPITVAAWEQGSKKPSGAAVKILDLIARKGLEILR